MKKTQAEYRGTPKYRKYEPQLTEEQTIKDDFIVACFAPKPTFKSRLVDLLCGGKKRQA